jgi:predicted PurR-regulated permease PerM
MNNLNPHRWSYDLRKWVIIGLVVAGVLFAYFIRDTIPVLVLSLLVAYLLNPIVTLLARRAKIARLAACALIYLGLIALLIGLGFLVAPNIVRQVSALVADFDSLVVRFLEASRQLPFLAALTADLNAAQLALQLRDEARHLAEQSPRFLAGAASSLLNVFVVLVLSFYLLKDADAFVHRIRASVPEAYRDDFERISHELDAVWSGFLRGQVLLAIIIGTVTTIALLILGVRNALLLGILAGILEVVPTIGPIIAMIPAVFIAFFQGSTNWQIDNTIFALIVILTYFGIQQLENHLIVPNVLGASVNLPPVLILAGTIVGASLAGVLGIFLAAPIIATVRLFFSYVMNKLFEPLPEMRNDERLASRLADPDSDPTAIQRDDLRMTNDQRLAAND